jgi:hypothetical protein
MRLSSKLAALGTIAALAVTPAAALASAHTPATKPTAKQVKFFGKYCKGESKKLRTGQKTSDFASCVLAMVKVAKAETTPNANLTTARISKLEHSSCKAESRKALTGQKHSPFSLCVSAARKLTADEEASQGGIGY